MSFINKNILYVNEIFVIYENKIVYREKIEKEKAVDVLTRLGLTLKGSVEKKDLKWQQSVGAING